MCGSTLGLPLAAQRQPLRDAEAMLLVDDRESEAVERNGVLDQRVRADDELRLAARHGLLRRALRRRAKAPDEPRDVDVERRQPLRDLAEVLLGEDFGGRHQRHLEAALDRAGGGQRRHHRLAAADVALHEPMHGPRAGEVGLDLGPHPVLRPRELERQAVAQLRRQLTRASQRMRAPLLARVARRAQGDLLREQFVELQALPRGIRPFRQRVRVGVGRRVVQAPDRGRERGQSLLVQQGRRQDLDDVDVAQRAVDALAQPALRHALGRRVDGRQRAGQRVARVDPAHAGMHHLRAGQSAAHAAERADAPANFELLQLRGIEVQEAQRQFAAVVAHGDAQLPASPVDDVGRDDLGLDLRFAARHQLGDRRDAGFVLVAQRQVQHEVPVARQPGAREFRGDRVARRRRGIARGALRAGADLGKLATYVLLAPGSRLCDPGVIGP